MISRKDSHGGARDAATIFSWLPSIRLWRRLAFRRMRQL